jgi:hypothetical protein
LPFCHISGVVFGRGIGLGGAGKGTMMNTEITFGLILLACLMGAVVLGMYVRQVAVGLDGASQAETQEN